MNEKLKLYAYGRGVRMWEVARKMGVRPETLTRRMREKLSKDSANAFRAAVDEIAAERKGNAGKDTP